MTIQDLRKLYDERPFQPFRIHLADGRSVFVAHPEFIAFSPTGRGVIVYEPDGSFHIVDILLVTDLHAKANGHSRKKRNSK